jgi:ABC-type Fe3+-siderophore transport system permease subunit
VLDLLLYFVLPVLALMLPVVAMGLPPSRLMLATLLLWLLWLRTLFRFYGRVARSNFPAADVAISIVGVPMFCWLLVRSYLHHRVTRSVDWKGRRYKTGR